MKAFDLIPVVEQVLPDRQKTEVRRGDLDQRANSDAVACYEFIYKGSRFQQPWTI